MAQLVFALLDFRRLILLAILAGGVSAISVSGPPELQAPVNGFIVTPIAQLATGLWHQFDHRAAAGHEQQQVSGS